MLIDTHCHLDAAEFDQDRTAVVDAAAAAGVRWIVVPSVETGNFDAVARLSRDHHCCVYTLGIHPMYVDRASDADLERLRARVDAAIGDPRFIGIGEIGLDFFVDGLDRARQLHFFDFQLALARERALPVLLHVRRAQDAVLARLRRQRPPGGIAHAFNGSTQQAEAFLELGFALGFGGAMTFERALRIRGLASRLPEHAAVLETDAPDIAPAWCRRARNSPVELPAIATVFAALRGLDRDHAIAACAGNALRVLPRLRALVDAGVSPHPNG